LTRAEFDLLRTLLTETSFEDYLDGENDPVRRFRIVYQRAKGFVNRPKP